MRRIQVGDINACDADAGPRGKPPRSAQVTAASCPLPAPVRHPTQLRRKGIRHSFLVVADGSFYQASPYLKSIQGLVLATYRNAAAGGPVILVTSK